MSIFNRLFKGKEEQTYETYTFRHKGYILQQTSYNWHYIIAEEATGETVMHAQGTEKLTEAEAQKAIEACIQLAESTKE